MSVIVYSANRSTTIEILQNYKFNLKCYSPNSLDVQNKYSKFFTRQIFKGSGSLKYLSFYLFFTIECTSKLVILLVQKLRKSSDLT